MIAISLIVAFIYGSLVWHIFPWQIHDPISWEGHLAGGFTGTSLSVWLRNSEPQKPVELWPEDEENDSLEYLQESDQDEQKENQIII